LCEGLESFWCWTYLQDDVAIITFSLIDRKFIMGECKIECLNIGKNYTPYKSIQFFLNDPNGHGCYFLKCYYYNLWTIHVQSPINLPKSMWKLVFNVVDVIFLIWKS
jgi:hypothetical protein